MKLVVGLGNPGNAYRNHRHNVGFMAVDALHDRHLGSEWREKHSGLLSRAIIAGRDVTLLKPQSFMNLSGRAVLKAVQAMGLKPADIMVVHDELELPYAELRAKLGGGLGGHNGLRDIHAQLGSADYWRLRLGIGHPGVKAEVADYVLRKPPADERQAIERAIDDSLKQLDALLSGQMPLAVMKLHAKPERPKPPRPAPTPPQGEPS